MNGTRSSKTKSDHAGTEEEAEDGAVDGEVAKTPRGEATAGATAGAGAGVAVEARSRKVRWARWWA